MKVIHRGYTVVAVLRKEHGSKDGQSSFHWRQSKQHKQKAEKKKQTQKTT